LDVSEPRSDRIELIIAIEVGGRPYRFTLNNHICEWDGFIGLCIIDATANNSLSVEALYFQEREYDHKEKIQEIPNHIGATHQGAIRSKLGQKKHHPMQG
jgi:hypothetical protein